MVTSLTTYGTTTASGTLSAANTLVTGTGGATTNKNTSVLTSTGYGEIWSQGTAGAWAAAGSIGSPTGHGFLLDSTVLEGNQIIAGNWQPTLRFNTNSGTVVADLYVQAFARSSGGSYTLIGSSMLLSAQTINTTITTYTWGNTSQPSQNFNTGDKLYWHIWPNITSGGGATTVIKLYESSSSTQGNVVNQLVTPGYQAIPAGTHFFICDGMGGVFS